MLKKLLGLQSCTNCELAFRVVAYNLLDIGYNELLKINGPVYIANEADNYLLGPVDEYHASYISLFGRLNKKHKVHRAGPTNRGNNGLLRTVKFLSSN